MNRFANGVLSGLIATIVLSLLMFAKGMMGIMPNLNVIAMLTQMAHHFMGTPPIAAVGWMLHFVIGTLAWGILYVLAEPAMPAESGWGKGMIFGMLAWLVMMVVVMPMAGAGFFGFGLSLAAPVMTLMLHLVYGAVLGGTYGRLYKICGTATAA